MPTPFIEKLSKKGLGSVPHLEKKWEDAKAAAKKQGQEDNHAYITTIFKTMVGAKMNASTRLLADSVDTVCMDVPFMIRIMELCKEEIQTDADLHFLAERIISQSSKGTLTMDDYQEVAVPTTEGR